LIYWFVSNLYRFKWIRNWLTQTVSRMKTVWAWIWDQPITFTTLLINKSAFWLVFRQNKIIRCIERYQDCNFYAQTKPNEVQILFKLVNFGHEVQRTVLNCVQNVWFLDHLVEVFKNNNLHRKKYISCAGKWKIANI
jgi:hypothetical protein